MVRYDCYEIWNVVEYLIDWDWYINWVLGVKEYKMKWGQGSQMMEFLWVLKVNVIRFVLSFEFLRKIFERKNKC